MQTGATAHKLFVFNLSSVYDIRNTLMYNSDPSSDYCSATLHVLVYDSYSKTRYRGLNF